MSSCICPACLMEKNNTPDHSYTSTKKNQLKGSEKGEQIQSERSLTPSQSTFSYLNSHVSFTKQYSLFTFDKYTTNISTGLSSIPINTSSPSSNDSSGSNKLKRNEHQQQFVKEKMANVEVKKDGIIDYPLYEGQSLGGIWNIRRDPQGPIVTPKNGYLDFSIDNLQIAHQYTYITINTPLPTKGGSLFTFRARPSIIQNTGEWWDGSIFHTLAQSNISPNYTKKWNDIVMAFSPTSVSVWENGLHMFNWEKSVDEKIKPIFYMQVRDVGGKLSFQIGNIFAVPPLFLASVNTPWDYALSKSSLPDPTVIKISQQPDRPFKVSFEDTFMRISAQPLKKHHQWVYVELTPKLPTYSIIICRLRINESGGYESKIHFFGNNILRITDSGKTLRWQYWSDQQFHDLASSNITIGDFFLVTMITTENRISFLENGIFKFTRNWNREAKLSIAHLRVDTNLSIDLSGIRTLPSSKSPALLLTDLQPSLLAYFPLKGSIENVMSSDQQLVMTEEGSQNFIQGPFGLAANFSGKRTALQMPQLQNRLASSYTLSAWTKVNSYPDNGKLTGIAGPILLNSDGKVVYHFIYNKITNYNTIIFTSNRSIEQGNWYNIIVTYSYDESRLSIYINGLLDQIIYLSLSECSQAAIIPSVFFIGGYKESFDEPLVVLDGAVGDVMIFTQYIQDNIALVLSNNNLNLTQTSTENSRLVPLFILVVWNIMRIGIENKIASQLDLQSALNLEEVVNRICDIVYVPATPSKRVTRKQLGISESYRIHLDIGGEGPMHEFGINTGFMNAININEVKTISFDGPLNKKPIPFLVQVARWITDPAYPFEDNFADQISMIGGSLTPKNIDEIVHVIRDGGVIDLWISSSFEEAVEELANRLNSWVVEPEDLPMFKANGPNEKNGGSWFVRKSIVARKYKV
ncbi:hypothetical protein C1645_812318 [Glomus cerebriforme]|uniref:Concanavalin A-like lectin/glucanase domain-containing protein n=1 Tax=Glomus cerebriforme TaxID=658196 RepID=A0A397TQU9_9GLOM|nr:hypothetical protein C1645_812318 [Glomus cerebriforme]